MSSTDAIEIRLGNAEKTTQSGRSLAQSLYGFPAHISLEGPIGAGKTTFVQGFAAGLGVQGFVSSPTFALEQRYALPSGNTLSHVDLYRLDAPGAKRLLEELDEADIRCVEWADRTDAGNASVRLRFREAGDERALDAAFDDVDVPDDARIDAWRADAGLPPNIIAHCDAVGDLAERFARALGENGVIARPRAVRAAGRLHDLLRFIDFRDGAGPRDFKPEPGQPERWAEWKKRFEGLKHEEACERFLRQEGFETLGRIVGTHGVRLPPGDAATTEQLVLFYADKRVAEDRIVSLTDRFADFARRYGQAHAEKSTMWFAQSAAVEKKLFPEGPPF
jgi:tRNA threonylcarbamoyl adenosine modification protein YjeE